MVRIGSRAIAAIAAHGMTLETAIAAHGMMLETAIVAHGMTRSRC